ncbi:hypothetical protein KO481_34430 [Nocardia sp. NEAU-G5]|uniref:TetR family transcriptional regulator n=1 Tax=Nocardia albiluteola TaxID=2842303 RepID=A0ABS6BA30_9NOCA|nr:hypothetical protein [Nocardia albiluteola]MBU3066601.1 hypothetical protein [Nocardia albiluteola]
MSPRQYNLGKCTAQVEQSRRQVLDAARALLGEGDSYTGFTVDAVAKRAADRPVPLSRSAEALGQIP